MGQLLLGDVQVHDPAFQAEDITLLQSLNVRVLAEEEGAQRARSIPGLIYMPHCPRSLYESLIRANLEGGTLNNCFLIGNKLDFYVSTTTTTTATPFIAKVMSDERTKIWEFPETFEHNDVFNDTALHIFTDSSQ